MSPPDEATGDGVAARRLALDVLGRIETEGAYANLALGPALERSGLSERDRGFVTELVYGTTRMRRACQFLVARHRDGGVSDRVAAALRLGAYQLAFADVAAHAAVDATVSASPRPARGLVNAVLRRIAADVAEGIETVEWPDAATRLSYPDWIPAALTAAIGETEATAALAVMNRPAPTHVRDDGYVQDLASQAVVDAVAALSGERIVDLCAAPGGKATGLADRGAAVLAGDLTAGRVRLIAENATNLDLDVAAYVADGRRTPLADASVDAVLVDAPCTGLGVLRRRADARWRIDADAVDRLVPVQEALLAEAARICRPTGRVVYSVCTLTQAETAGVVKSFVSGSGWKLSEAHTLVPTDERDGMYLAALMPPSQSRSDPDRDA